MLVVGLTGGIGSGKTRASNAFQNLGITIVDTDVIAKTIVTRGSDCLTEIHRHFGDSILLPNGSLNRKRLREIIFSDPLEKKWVEALLHPLIRKQTCRQLAEAQSSYCILVSPLLLESTDAAYCDKIVIVDTTVELQIQRTIKRDRVSKEQAERTIAAQMRREDRLSRASDVIDNTGEWPNTYAQILSLHEKYLQHAQELNQKTRVSQDNKQS